MRRKLAVFALIAILPGLLFGCYGNGEVPPSTEPSTAPSEAIPESSAVEETVETEIPETSEPVFPLHSGIQENGAFDSGTLFIGDSLTFGLVKAYLTGKDLLGDAKYMAMSGAAVTAFFEGPRLKSYKCAYSPEFEGMLFYEAAEFIGSEITAVYFMMGTNHSDAASADTYIEITEFLLEVCPNATVYLQTVPFATSSAVNYKEANRRILTAYDHFFQKQQPRVQLIDTQTAIGYSLLADGIHLDPEGQEKWYQALVEFAQANQIQQ